MFTGADVCKVARSCSVGFVFSGHGHGSLTELTEVPINSTGMAVLQNSDKFRAGTRLLYPSPCPYPGMFKGHTRTQGIVPRACRTYTNSGYGYKCRTATYRTCGYG